MERSHWSAVDLPVALIELLLKLVALVLVEAQLLLQVLDSLLKGVEILVVRLSLSLQSLVHFHQVIVEDNQLLHLRERILSHLLMRLELILIQVLEALQSLLQLFGVTHQNLVFMGQELDPLLELLFLSVLAVFNLVQVTLCQLEVVQDNVS